MKVKLSSGKEVGVYISHRHPPITLPKGRTWLPATIAENERQLDEAGTYATVKVDDREYRGRAKLAREDMNKFNKHKGLTIALKRALYESPLEKSERSELWEKVFAGKYSKAA